MQKRHILIFTVTFLAISITIYYLASIFNLIDNNFGIDANGSVSLSIPIQRNGDLYTFTNNTQRFTIRRSNILIDGNSYNSSLIILDHVTNVTIKNLNINGSYAARTKFHEVAMYLDSSSNNKILNCYFTGDSLSLQDSHKNTIIGNIDLRLHMVDSDSNIIANNSLAGTIATESIELRNAANNLILRNNGTKISLVWSTNNLIFGNRITGPNWSWLFISDGSSQNMFVANEVVGPFIIESSIQSGDNLFYHNNFMKAWTAKYHITDYDPNLVDNIEVTGVIT